MTEARYRIGTVARLAGMTTHAVRVWERRYGVLAPARSQGGARLYSDRDVEQLKLLKRAVDSGHPIGQIARLGRAELERLATARTPEPAPETRDEHLLDELLRAVERFDAIRAEQLLALAQARYSARALVSDVLAPLLGRIGNAWADGRLCAASEHAATVLVRERAGALLRQFPRDPVAPLLVASTPQGELHELGALLASVVAATQGFGVVYLGPNLPAAEIAIAVKATRAEIVALSIVALDSEPAARELQALAGKLPKRVSIVLGGARAPEVAALSGVVVVTPKSLDEFERWLASRRTPARA